MILIPEIETVVLTPPRTGSILIDKYFAWDLKQTRGRLLDL